jgi:hypothetical protein
MAGVFTPRANLFARATLAAAALTVGGVAVFAFAYVRSSYWTGVGVDVYQPVPFSHHHHVSGLGIDCRYCHATAEISPYAGMPTTDTCMNCHAQVWTDSPMLEPVRQSWKTGVPIKWRRVHDLADFVFFDHSIHVAKGIGCATCHGQVDQMRLMHKAEPLTMQWCLDCHRNPTANVRPLSEIYSMTSNLPDEQTQRELADAHKINEEGLTNCSKCHR